MGSSKPKAAPEKKTASQRAKDREPRPGLKDEKSLAEAEASPVNEDNGADESQERNEKVSEAMEEEEPDEPRSVKDGGYEGEDLPVVRVGEVYEATRPDDHRRYVKVLLVEDDGRVLVQNEETYRKSHIDPERFVPSAGWWRRFAS